MCVREMGRERERERGNFKFLFSVSIWFIILILEVPRVDEAWVICNNSRIFSYVDLASSEDKYIFTIMPEA